MYHDSLWHDHAKKPFLQKRILLEDFPMIQTASTNIVRNSQETKPFSLAQASDDVGTAAIRDAIISRAIEVISTLHKEGNYQDINTYINDYFDLIRNVSSETIQGDGNPARARVYEYMRNTGEAASEIRDSGLDINGVHFAATLLLFIFSDYKPVLDTQTGEARFGQKIPKIP
jgi:hypothetical protein